MTENANSETASPSVLEPAAWDFKSPSGAVRILRHRKPCMVDPGAHFWTPLVRHSDAARLIAERDARIAELRARFDATQSMFMSAIHDLAAINERLGCDPNDGGAVPIIEAIDELKRMIADQASKGQRLALELECLLRDIKDNAVVSKWWDSAWDAIEDWRKV